MKKYSEALKDLNAAIEADPALSEAYWHRASILRQLCRFSLAAVELKFQGLYLCVVGKNKKQKIKICIAFICGQP